MNDSREGLSRAADRVCRYMVQSSSRDWGMNMNEWDWVPGVGAIALFHYFESTGQADVLDYLLEWVERNKGKAGRKKVINAMAPYAIFPGLYKRTGEPYYLEESRKIAGWIVREAPRTREGALEHTVTENVSFPEQVWADTLFMAVMLLGRQAEAAQDKELAEQALKQVELHLQLLQDEQTGVLYHGWNCAERNHLSAARWTRANAWVCVAVPDIVHRIGKLTEIPPAILSRYRWMIDGLLPYQGANGLWTTVLDRPDFYEETSGSAGIACGILLAVRTGLLEPSYRKFAVSALKGVVENITAEGEVLNVSGGTPIMPTVEDYQSIPRIPTLYGQGLVLMLLAEALRSNEPGGEYNLV